MQNLKIDSGLSSGPNDKSRLSFDDPTPLLREARDPREIYDILDMIAEVWSNNELQTIMSIITDYGKADSNQPDESTRSAVLQSYTRAREVDTIKGLFP
jgi:hypothetical protein